MVAANVPMPMDRIAAFCTKWKIIELSLFGSVLDAAFRDDSDIDVLVTFAPDATWSYWEWPDMTDELQAIFGRPIDLVEAKSLKNPFRRNEILRTRRVVYAA